MRERNVLEDLKIPVRSFVPSLIETHDHSDRPAMFVLPQSEVVVVRDGGHVECLEKLGLDPVPALCDRIVDAVVQCIAFGGAHGKIREISGI